MKTIAQLLELKNNQYYSFTTDEQKLLDDFLSQQSDKRKQAKNNSKNLDGSTPATVHNKNVVATEKGILPTADHVAISQELAEQPATGNTPASDIVS